MRDFEGGGACWDDLTCSYAGQIFKDSLDSTFENADYDEAKYELLLRNFEAGDHRVPWHPTWMPNRKTDTNNNHAFSTDYIGGNYEYPEGSYATRARMSPPRHPDRNRELCRG